MSDFLHRVYPGLSLAFFAFCLILVVRSVRRNWQERTRLIDRTVKSLAERACDEQLNIFTACLKVATPEEIPTVFLAAFDSARAVQKLIDRGSRKSRWSIHDPAYHMRSYEIRDCANPLSVCLGSVYEAHRKREYERELAAAELAKIPKTPKRAVLPGVEKPAAAGEPTGTWLCACENGTRHNPWRQLVCLTCEERAPYPAPPETP